MAPWRHGLLLASLALLTGQAAAQTPPGSPDLYNDPTHGLRIIKPAGWEFLTLSSVLSEMRTRLAEQTGPTEAEALLKQVQLLVVIADRPGAAPEESARVTLVTEDLRAHPELKTPREYADANRKSLQQLVQDFRLEAPYTEVRAGSHTGLRYEYTARSSSDGSKPFRAIALHFLVERRGYVLSARAPVDHFPSRRPAFEAILKSFTFTR